MHRSFTTCTSFKLYVVDALDVLDGLRVVSMPPRVCDHLVDRTDNMARHDNGGEREVEVGDRVNTVKTTENHISIT